MRIGPIADADALGTKLESEMAVCNEQAMAKQKSPGETPGALSARGAVVNPLRARFSIPSAPGPGSPIHADQDSGRGRFGVEAAAEVTANKTAGELKKLFVVMVLLLLP